MSELNTQIKGKQIKDDTVEEVKLKVSNAPVDGYYLTWNDSEGKFEWSPGADAVTEAPSGDINGSNVTFTLSDTPLSGSLQVYLNGLCQEEGAGNDYTLSGSTITWAIAPIAGDIILTSYLKSAGGAGGGGASRYSTSFTNGDLSSGVLTVTHSLDEQYVQVQVFNNDDEKVIPDDIDLTNSSSLTVDLSSFGTITGTWHVVVLG